MGSDECNANRFLVHGIPKLDSVRELHCSSEANLVGWSNYPVFLQNWLKYFDREQLLVLYTEQFEKDPEVVLRATHHFLGVDHHLFPLSALQRTHYNTGSCGYGWDSSCEEEPEPSRAGVEVQSAPAAADHHRPSAVDLFLNRAVEGMLDLARQGLIFPPPLSWLGGDRLGSLNTTVKDYFFLHTQQVVDMAKRHYAAGHPYRDMLDRLRQT